MYPENDISFDDSTITKVTREGDYWSITKADGWSCGVPGDSPVVPAVGMPIRCYKMNGTAIRGMFIDGQRVFYRTKEQQQQLWDEELAARRMTDQLKADSERSSRDARWGALPAEFRSRRDRFMAGNPNFARDYETYELFCCEQAVAIYEALKGSSVTLEEFSNMSWAEQCATVPSLDDGHSGNTFGASCRLAHWLSTNRENVVHEHGALTTLVGCEDYGCTH